MRSLRLRFAPKASDDISGIHDWLSQRSASAATTVIRTIRATAELIAEYPSIGRNANIDGVKILPVVKYPYLVYYTIERDEVVIVHIRHGARAVPGPDEFLE